MALYVENIFQVIVRGVCCGDAVCISPKTALVVEPVLQRTLDCMRDFGGTASLMSGGVQYELVTDKALGVDCSIDEEMKRMEYDGLPPERSIVYVVPFRDPRMKVRGIPAFLDETLQTVVQVSSPAKVYCTTYYNGCRDLLECRGISMNTEGELTLDISKVEGMQGCACFSETNRQFLGVLCWRRVILLPRIVEKARQSRPDAFKSMFLDRQKVPTDLQYVRRLIADRKPIVCILDAACFDAADTTQFTQQLTGSGFIRVWINDTQQPVEPMIDGVQYLSQWDSAKFVEELEHFRDSVIFVGLSDTEFVTWAACARRYASPWFIVYTGDKRTSAESLFGKDCSTRIITLNVPLLDFLK